MEIAPIDDLEIGDVPVLACDGPTDGIAPLGELLTTAAAKRGASGCVTDGWSEIFAGFAAWPSPFFMAALVRSTQRAAAR